MSQTPREVVRRTLTFDRPERIPVNLWVLPWMTEHHPEETAALLADYPSDLAGAPGVGVGRRVRGNPYELGEYTDEWGCCFVNLQRGVIGEVKKPLVSDLADWRTVEPPWELIPGPEEEDAAIARINDFCRSTDCFVLTGCCPRIWERYQFLRGSENALMDVMLREPGVEELLNRIFEFYRREFEFWAKTEVDALSFMDDWGTQKALQIPPPIWRELFKPMYREFCRIGREAGKFMFMHSDGCITEIYPDLIEIGVSAVNSQLFCMDLAKLSEFRGRITFWGELDRQHVLCSADPEAGRRAVRQVAEQLYTPDGGIFCQFELGPGCNPATARAACEEWMKISARNRR